MEREMIGGNQIVLRVKKFLNLVNYKTKNASVEEDLKELCVAKLCDVLGIKCTYNYKSNFFKMFAEVFAQAICDILEIKISVADDSYRLFKYNGVNLIEETKNIILKETAEEVLIDELVLDVFNFLDKYKEIVEKKFRNF